MNSSSRYQALTRYTVQQLPQYQALPDSVRRAIQVVSAVFPFRTNRYVTDDLIDWSDVPNDPIFRLTFPVREMLDAFDFKRVAEALESGDRNRLHTVVSDVRYQHNPHPAGQLTHNVPMLNGKPVPGIQHKYSETVLYFPVQGQTCHAYCSYCFRWAQFIGDQDLKFAAKDPSGLVAYLKNHPAVTDVLFTGGDPAIMKSATLRRHILPLLDAGLEHVQTIRIGTKALAYWPYRFVTDDDAEDLLRLFEDVVSAGKHVAIMAHFSHIREMQSPVVHEAIRRLRDAGCEIRTQAPIMRGINDDPDVWADMWRESVRLGMIPYYMFVSRDTGPRDVFEISLAEAQTIFRDAYSQVSGLARTVRGPVMSATPGKVMIDGVVELDGDKAFVLQFLQGRKKEWVGKPFFADYDPSASWFFDLVPFDDESFPYEKTIPQKEEFLSLSEPIDQVSFSPQ